MGVMIGKIFRLLFGTLDRLGVFLLERAYEMFMQIADAGIFRQSTIRQFSTRIYAFLGLIMVFKVSISLVSYIMNPDNFSKGDVGAPAVLKGFIFALVGIVAVPYIFEIAFSAQRIILKENVIGNLIFGISAGTDVDSEEKDQQRTDYLYYGGRNMASTVLRAFIRPNTDIITDEGQITEDCAEAPANCEAFLNLFDKKDKIKAIYEKDPILPSDLLDSDHLTASVKSNGTEVFVVTYWYLITTICLVFIAYILLLFCFDIAVRSVKLSFLQLIAPIPLISKIDPKKGGKVFDSWVKECITTYLDLFFRLIAIYFGLFLITSLSGVYHVSTGGEYSVGAKIYVEIFLIIGILNFVRELPGLLGKILGIDFKGMGGFSLNPLKNKNLAPVGAIAGMGSAAASEFRRAWQRGKRDNDNKLVHPVRNALRSAAFGGIGAVGGALRGTAGVFKGKSYGDIIQSQLKRNEELELAQLQSDNDTLGSYKRSKYLSNFLGTRSEAQKIAVREADLKKTESEYNSKKAKLDLDEKDFQDRIKGKTTIKEKIAANEQKGKDKFKETDEYKIAFDKVEAKKAIADTLQQQFVSGKVTEAEYTNALREYQDLKRSTEYWAENDGLYNYIANGELQYEYETEEVDGKQVIKKDSNGRNVIKRNENGELIAKKDTQGNIVRKSVAAVETTKAVLLETFDEYAVNGELEVTLDNGDKVKYTRDKFEMLFKENATNSEQKEMADIVSGLHSIMGQLIGDVSRRTAEHERDVHNDKAELDALKNQIDETKRTIESDKVGAADADKIVDNGPIGNGSGGSK